MATIGLTATYLENEDTELYEDNRDPPQAPAVRVDWELQLRRAIAVARTVASSEQIMKLMKNGMGYESSSSDDEDYEIRSDNSEKDDAEFSDDCYEVDETGLGWDETIAKMKRAYTTQTKEGEEYIEKSIGVLRIGKMNENKPSRSSSDQSEESEMESEQGMQKDPIRTRIKNERGNKGINTTIQTRLGECPIATMPEFQRM